jgi:hypothetical protein
VALAGVKCEPFTERERIRIRKLCTHPDFLREVERLANIARRLRKRGEPTDAELAVTLDNLSRATRSLHNRVSDLPGKLNVALLGELGDRYALSRLIVELKQLVDASSKARSKLRPRTGPRRNDLARAYAAEVRKLLKTHGVSAKHLATVLRIVLGLSARSRIDHLK